jgi:hypothetical protein
MRWTLRRSSGGKGEGPCEAARRQHPRIGRGAGGLFAQLIDLSQLETGALHPSREAFPLEPLFTRVAADLAPQALANGLALRVVRTGLAVDTDPVLLERILRNFVTNAVRYTRKGGIAIGARRRGGTVRIDVVDTGAGIADADRGRVFDEFVQLAATPRHHAGGRGMGLGLAIVRRLANLLGHRIEMDSVPGRGSRFSIVVPRTIVSVDFRGAHSRSSQRIRLRRWRSPAGRSSSSMTIPVVAAMRALFASWKAVATGGADASEALAALKASEAQASAASTDRRRSSPRGRCFGNRRDLRLRNALGSATPALIVSGDTSVAARPKSTPRKFACCETGRRRVAQGGCGSIGANGLAATGPARRARFLQVEALAASGRSCRPCGSSSSAGTNRPSPCGSATWS